MLVVLPTNGVCASSTTKWSRDQIGMDGVELQDGYNTMLGEMQHMTKYKLYEFSCKKIFYKCIYKGIH
jgi:hypothetical protein